MNNLKVLRLRAKITTRELEKCVGINICTLNLIENGKQPMRELHVLKLTNFFDVTSDYLLGYSNSGIGMYFTNSEYGDDHAMISESELTQLNERYEIKETLIHHSASNWKIKTNAQVTQLYTGEHSIFREVNVSKEDANISTSIREQAISELNRLETRDLEKVLKFINEYIK